MTRFWMNILFLLAFAAGPANCFSAAFGAGKSRTRYFTSGPLNAEYGKSDNSRPIPPGWVGGYSQAHPELAYPRITPDLSSLPMEGNLENVDKLNRMQKVHWPEFSWLEKKGDPSSRLYRKFYDNISRIGYTNEGRVYSIICPQMGTEPVPALGTFNVEVHVTGTRGWIEEATNTVCAELGVEGHVWLSMNEEERKQNKIISKIESMLNESGHPFPFSKEHALVVPTHFPKQPYNLVIPVTNGTATDYAIPKYAQHWDGQNGLPCFGVANIECEVADVTKTGDKMVDDFNEMLLHLFNLGSGQMLENGSIINWNLWLSSPELVDQDEWSAHAEKFRTSIDVEHEHLMPIRGLKNFDGKDVYLQVAGGEAYEALEKFFFKHAKDDVVHLLDWLKPKNVSLGANIGDRRRLDAVRQARD